jgi:hypothetical protein
VSTVSGAGSAAYYLLVRDEPIGFALREHGSEHITQGGSMDIRRSAVGVLGMCFGITLAACTRDGLQEPLGPRDDLRLASEASIRQPVRTIREEFRDMSVRFPGFGGIWIDDNDRLVINFAGDDVPNALPGAVRAWLHAFGRSDLAQRATRIHKVERDYSDLYTQLNAIKVVAADYDIVTSLGIDEMSGRVTVGIRDEGSLPRLQQGLADRSVVTEAVTFAITGPVVEVQGLQSMFSDMMGGIQINRHSGAGGSCSIGFVGFRQMTGMPWPYADFSQIVLTTAAHCTSSQLAMSGDAFGQPDINRPVGVEIDEAEIYLQGSSYCGSYTYCRFADVAVVQISNGISSWPTRAAKSSSVTSGNPPYLGWQNYTGSGVKGVLAGDMVTKVGRTTGQTSARVVSGCYDIQSSSTPGLWTLCAAKAPLGVKGGDSGAPVFIPSIKVIGGLVFAASTTSKDSYFSRIEHVEPALGYRHVFSF